VSVARNLISARYHGSNTRVPRSAQQDEAPFNADDSPAGGPRVAVWAPALASSTEQEHAGAATLFAGSESLPRVIRLAPPTSARAAYHARGKCYHAGNVQYQFRGSITVSPSSRTCPSVDEIVSSSSLQATRFGARQAPSILSQNLVQVIRRYHNMKGQYRVVSHTTAALRSKRLPRKRMGRR
jgi:hypothetical protein